MGGLGGYILNYMFFTSFAFLASALEQFDIMPVFGPAIGGINNLVLAMSFIVFFLCFVFVGARSLVNERTLFLLYVYFRFIRQIISENAQMPKNIYFYYTAALFGFIITSNLLGLIPYSLTITSYLVITLFLSSMSFFGNLIIGLRVHSFKFFAFFVPAGAPTALIPLLICIEFVSYSSRLFSLAIRLFANMMAGHALLKILSGFVYLFLSMGTGYYIVPMILNVLVLAVTGLEFMIAFLQAYVFVVLSTIYTNEAINLH